MQAPDSHGQEAGGAPLSEWRDCPGTAACSSCFWHTGNGGRCPGCDAACQSRCLKRSCEFSCHQCAGGRHASTPGCCGRVAVLSPEWRERLRELLEEPVPPHAPAPLSIRCPLIPVVYGQTRKHRLADRFPEIDAWAAPIHKLADRAGRFRSHDLKDYLGLPADRKLILSTCAPDDYQEMLWRLGGDIDFAGHGIDYWFPAHFSIYDDDCRLYQFVSAKRQQLSAVATASRFAWFRLGESLPIDFLAPMRGAPSVLISSQQVFSKRNLAILHREVMQANNWFPPETAFFLIGNKLDLPISSSHRRYCVNSRWLLLALKGRDLRNRPVKELPMADLLARNLKEMLNRVEQAWN